jgi:hypothetical protein
MQKNQTIRNAKANNLISSKTTKASGQQHKQWIRKSAYSADGSGAVKTRHEQASLDYQHH